MTRLLSVEEVLTLLDGDRQLFEELVQQGLCHPAANGVSAEEAEAARVARVLWRELEVNWPGVEVALALRQQVFELRRQMAELLELLSERRSRPGS